MRPSYAVQAHASTKTKPEDHAKNKGEEEGENSLIEMHASKDDLPDYADEEGMLLLKEIGKRRKRSSSL